MDAATPEDDAGIGARAADVVVADLRPRPGGRLIQGARLAGAAGDLLAQIRDELERLDAAAFLTAWSEPAPPTR